ncbi:putative toluene tolerance protein Ttg2F [Acinetobacter baylyi ADP1]|nr:putative toluene tolerance protein Ttg2F [Acinetobacter baylyi ADP1]
MIYSRMMSFYTQGCIRGLAMNSEQLTQILQEAFPESEVAVSGQAGKFDLRIVDDQFEGKRTVARQQAVYAPLNSYIASGEVHAVTIRAMTKEEWRKASLFGA